MVKIFQWIKDKFNRKPKEEIDYDDEPDLLYCLTIGLDSNQQFIIVLDAQENEIAQQALAILLYNGFREPLRERIAEFLKEQDDDLSRDILKKLEFMINTEFAIKQKSKPCISPLELFKIVGGNP